MKQKKYKEILIHSITAGVLGWLFFILADACDEYLLNVGCRCGWWAIMLVPPLLAVSYCLNCMREKYTVKESITWISSFFLSSIVALFVIAGLMRNGVFPIKQIQRENGEYNGAEYAFYTVFAILGTIALCGLFHLSRFIINLIKKKVKVMK